MAKGVKIKEITVGTGALVERGNVVRVHIRGFLNRGEVCYDTYKQGKPSLLDLSKRENIAGLRTGIEGMREGGRRELLVSPHLAYGEKGVEGLIPPNAVIRFEIELLEVRKAHEMRAEDHAAGKTLLVFRPGEAAENVARWQFSLREGSSAGATVTYPVPRTTWRHARIKQVDAHLSSSELNEVLESAQAILSKFPAECLGLDDLWADSSEKANSITRDRKTNSRCVTICLWERGVLIFHYALPECSEILKASPLFRIISRELAPYLPGEAAC